MRTGEGEAWLSIRMKLMRSSKMVKMHLLLLIKNSFFVKTLKKEQNRREFRS